MIGHLAIHCKEGENVQFTPDFGSCTTEAHDMMGQLHDRMPIILPRHAVDHWLDPAVSDPTELKPMLKQFLGEEMQSWPVGKAVGNVRNQGPALMEPVGAASDVDFG